MMRTLGDMEVFTQLTNELRDTHGEARRTRTWHRLTKGSLGSSGIILVVALEYNVKEGDVDWRSEEHQYLHYQMA